MACAPRAGPRRFRYRPQVPGSLERRGFLGALALGLGVTGFRRGIGVTGPAPAAARPAPASAARAVVVTGSPGVGAVVRVGGRPGVGSGRSRGSGRPLGLRTYRRRLEHHLRRLEYRRRHARGQLASITPVRRLVIEFSVVQLALEHSGNLQSGSRARGIATFRSMAAYHDAPAHRTGARCKRRPGRSRTGGPCPDGTEFARIPRELDSTEPCNLFRSSRVRLPGTTAAPS